MIFLYSCSADPEVSNMIASKHRPEGNRNQGFGSHKPLVDALPQINALRIRVELDVKYVERVLDEKPEPGVHHSLHEVQERKRLSLGALGACLPTILLVLESDSADPNGLKALSLLSEHGTNEEIRLAARILLDRCSKDERPEAASHQQSPQACSVDLP
jgi:hypothetical protein